MRGVSFRDQLIDICASHNLDVGVLAETIGPYDDRFPRALPIGGQRLNAQFCAAILRLADILDFDRERTPPILFEGLGVSYSSIPGSEVSIAEWQKHMAVHSLELAEDLVISAESRHPAIERSILIFCKEIERELRDTTAVLRRNTPDILSRYNIDVPITVRPRIRSVGYIYKEMSLRLNEAAIMNLLMGERLYSHPGVAVRELVQNGLDACSVRRLMGDSVAPIITVRFTSRGRETWLEVEDNGMGMDEHVLSEYFLRVGSSYYDSPEFGRVLGERGMKRFVPISRFGLGLLAVFMIGDVLEVTTRAWRSPRADDKCRTVRVDSRGGLAFVTEASSGPEGTTVAVRLKPGAQHEWLIASILRYVESVVVRPAWPVRIEALGRQATITPGAVYSVRGDGLRELRAKAIEVAAVELERWSDTLTGVVVLAFRVGADGKLSHLAEGRRIVFGTKGSPSTLAVDPATVLGGYQGNRLTVNGFAMNLRKVNRIFGPVRGGLRMAFDVDVRAAGPITFDVARSRLIGEGAAEVRRELRASILRGLAEMGVRNRLADDTEEMLLRLREPPVGEMRWSGGGNALDEGLLSRVAMVVPADVWPVGLHKEIAERLGISNSLAYRALSQLIDMGRIVPPNTRLGDAER